METMPPVPVPTMRSKREVTRSGANLASSSLSTMTSTRQRTPAPSRDRTLRPVLSSLGRRSVEDRQQKGQTTSSSPWESAFLIHTQCLQRRWWQTGSGKTTISTPARRHRQHIPLLPIFRSSCLMGLTMGCKAFWYASVSMRRKLSNCCWKALKPLPGGAGVPWNPSGVFHMHGFRSGHRRSHFRMLSLVTLSMAGLRCSAW
mmetsp:Transcript_105063/g.328593  ORF Transcript_105063/g.328593 Transcript_105063/m.328593 type:complete len:202 (+) Transcript_105063:522-1127(+)